MAKSARMCIDTNDFKEAKSRFDNAYSNWKEHWFNTCYKIAQNCQEWFKEYGFDFDEINVFPLKKRMSNNNLINSYVYLIKMFDDNGQYVYLKIGKTVNLKRRYRELRNTRYADGTNVIWTTEIKTWELPSDFLATSFEHILHHYLSTQNLENIPNDRWTPTELTEEQFKKIEEKYKTFCQLM